MKHGFIQVAAATPEIRVADCTYNAEQIIALCQQATENGIAIAAFPELCITGYTCGDLFSQSVLLDGAERALAHILKQTAHLDLIFAVGIPLRCGGKLYNCAATCYHGELLGIVPKVWIPNYGEFYEKRWFEAGKKTQSTAVVCGQTVPFGTDLLFSCQTMPSLTIGIEICEDLWAPDPPSRILAQTGATLILNLSASDETVGKDSYRRQLVTTQSGRLVCAYVYANAGEGESTTDLVFGGHNLIAENGALLAERRFATGLTAVEVDLDRITNERRRMSTFTPPEQCEMRTISFALPVTETALTRHIPAMPFVPEDAAGRNARCEEILTIAALGLKKRMAHTHAKSAVIGLSGGLDSTLAILIVDRAMKLLGRPASDIIAVTMPCFGTTDRTRDNAVALAEELGATLRRIDIGEAVTVHFKDISHPFDQHDVTFENGQARERTQVLMDIANQCGGLVIGTGDLSELALGWATYNGDHMSMYGVNASIPKTLVRHLVDYAAHEVYGGNARLSAVLSDILDTPVSPELLPAVNGTISQKTEDLVGPYELHDFFLYYIVRCGFPPAKVLRLADYALGDRYDHAVLFKWLNNFYRRFFSQQFKRSCLPDGPKIGSLTLSPRGDWRMPSDAAATLWQSELDALHESKPSE